MEIDDALVTAITRELMKRLEAGGEGSSFGKKPLVITGDCSSLQDLTLKRLEADYDVARHTGLEASFPDDAGVLVTNLSIQALVRLAEGDAGCTPEGAALLWALVRGKHPVIVEEGIEWRKFKESIPAPLASKYIAHERSLALYGAVFVREAMIPEALSGKASPAPVSGAAQTCNAPPAQGKDQGGKKRVINEVELMRLCPVAAGEGQSVTIGAKDILTPLARDYVTKMRILVNRVD